MLSGERLIDRGVIFAFGKMEMVGDFDKSCFYSMVGIEV